MVDQYVRRGNEEVEAKAHYREDKGDSVHYCH